MTEKKVNFGPESIFPRPRVEGKIMDNRVWKFPMRVRSPKREADIVVILWSGSGLGMINEGGSVIAPCLPAKENWLGKSAAEEGAKWNWGFFSSTEAVEEKSFQISREPKQKPERVDGKFATEEEVAVMAQEFIQALADLSEGQLQFMPRFKDRQKV